MAHLFQEDKKSRLVRFEKQGDPSRGGVDPSPRKDTIMLAFLTTREIRSLRAQYFMTLAPRTLIPQDPRTQEPYFFRSIIHQEIDTSGPAYLRTLVSQDLNTSGRYCLRTLVIHLRALVPQDLTTSGLKRKYPTTSVPQELRTS